MDSSSLESGLPSLDGLEEWERRQIMAVLQRDVAIQKQKDLQIRRLRSEMEKLSQPLDNNDSEKCCFRCRTSLGLLKNSGAPCPKCRARVCVSCRVQSEGYRLGWICVLCDKMRQYAVLAGEWIQPNNVTPTKRGRTLTKSNSTLALRIRNQHTENDYFPAATAPVIGSATTDSSISGVLLRQLREESMHSWRNVDTAGLPPQTNRNSQTKLADQELDVRGSSDEHRPRSPSLNTAGRSSLRQSATVVGAVHAFTTARREASVPHSWSSVKDIDSANGMSTSSTVPMLRVEHIEEESMRGSSTRKSWRESTMERSLLNAFNRGLRCPSVPNQLETKTKENPLTSLLSVHNVRVSVRSTSSDNVSSSAVSSPRDRDRDRSSDSRCKQHSDNDIRNFCAAFADRNRQSLVGDKKYVERAQSELCRPPSQNSAATTNDISESWDDNISLSGESVVSISSCSVTSSVMKHSLKRVKEDSRSSLNSGGSSKITVQGEILMSCNYNCVDASLEVHVIKCKNLYPMNTKKNRSNPYVKMYLLPDVSPLGKRKTRIKRRTVNPDFNEILKFSGLTKSELEARTLLITVWHYDVVGRSHFMGEIRLKMSDYPWIPGETYWLQFGPHVPDVEPEKEILIPNIMISVKFSCPDVGKKSEMAGSVQCMVRCPQNLPNARVSAGAPCYIKCYLYPDHRKLTKQKSPLMKLGTDPTWKHTFAYDDLTVVELRERCLELTVWAHQRMGANEFLGGVRLNMGTGFSDGDKVDWMDSSQEEALVWKEMLVRSNSWVDVTLPLRLDMESKL